MENFTNFFKNHKTKIKKVFGLVLLIFSVMVFLYFTYITTKVKIGPETEFEFMMTQNETLLGKINNLINTFVFYWIVAIFIILGFSIFNPIRIRLVILSLFFAFIFGATLVIPLVFFFKTPAVLILVFMFVPQFLEFKKNKKE